MWRLHGLPFANQWKCTLASARHPSRRSIGVDYSAEISNNVVGRGAILGQVGLMFQFLLVHYLAIATVLIPVVCCCTTPQRASGSVLAENHERGASHRCCCNGGEEMGDSKAPVEYPARSPGKQCPCQGAKSFLGSLSNSESNTKYSTSELGNLLGIEELSPALVSINLPQAVSASQLVDRGQDSPFISSIEILRAKSLLRC